MLNKQTGNLNINRNISPYQQHSSLDISSTSQVMKSINFEVIIDTLGILFLEMYGRRLNTVEKLLLKGVWQHHTYSKIARENNYSSDYLSNVAAPKLLKQLSQLFNCRITKKNCRSLVTKYCLKTISQNSKKSLNSQEKSIKKINIIYTQKSNYSFKNSCFNSCFLKDAIILSQVI